MDKIFIKVYKYLSVLFLLLFPVSCFACPGCSMFNIFRISLQNQGDIKWAYTIIIFILATPLILYFLGFRLKKVENISRFEKWSFTILLFLGWILIMFADSFSSNFGIFLMHWFYLPLVIQFNIIMAFAFGVPILLILPAFVIPGIYCYYLSRYLLKYKVERKS